MISRWLYCKPDHTSMPHSSGGYDMTRSPRTRRPAFFNVGCLLLPTAAAAFKSQHHDEITRTVLSADDLSRTIGNETFKFQPDAISQVAGADTGQDAGWCLFGSPSPPFSDSANH